MLRFRTVPSCLIGLDGCGSTGPVRRRSSVAFTTVARSVGASEVLYPGSYVDLVPSIVWPWVTYVDVDRRAGEFFDYPLRSATRSATAAHR